MRTSMDDNRRFTEGVIGSMMTPRVNESNPSPSHEGCPPGALSHRSRCRRDRRHMAVNVQIIMGAYG